MRVAGRAACAVCANRGRPCALENNEFGRLLRYLWRKVTRAVLDHPTLSQIYYSTGNIGSVRYIYARRIRIQYLMSVWANPNANDCGNILIFIFDGKTSVILANLLIECCNAEIRTLGKGVE